MEAAADRGFSFSRGYHAGKGGWNGAEGLTSAHADLAVGGGAEIAEEPLVWVAGVTLCAQFSQLLGADAAAAAAVQHQAHAGGAARRRFGCALTLCAAVLARSRLRRGRGGRSVCDRSSLCPLSVPSVSPGAYLGAEGEEHQGEADGTCDGGEHGCGAAGGCTTGCRGDERRGRSLDSDRGGGWCLDAPGGGVWGCRLGWGCCRL